ncbi:MAG TPA: 1,4-dihydroxy-6-naphthoate synthase [Mycobacteriales bacterium]|jgi:1,4-dihydroxy-6-naphthoate synthase
MALSLGFSPCPNDTFVFHALVHGLVEGPAVDVTYADIDVLNAHALAGDLDVVKVSYAVLPRLAGYTPLSSGGALGRGCGPLVVTRERADVRGATVAVPGEHTTAYLLLRLWDPGFGDVVVMPFDRIMPAVAAGEVDAGLVIHESRFTYPSYGLTAVADLGDWWEGETGLPIPLGAIVARDTLDTAALEAAIRRSVEHAWAHPEASRGYVLAHSQELAPDVVDAHIALYVNELTRDLGQEGRRAAAELLARAAARGLVPDVRV